MHTRGLALDHHRLPFQIGVCIFFVAPQRMQHYLGAKPSIQPVMLGGRKPSYLAGSLRGPVSA